jgi:hypothetical protein
MMLAITAAAAAILALSFAIGLLFGRFIAVGERPHNGLVQDASGSFPEGDGFVSHVAVRNTFNVEQ